MDQALTNKKFIEQIDDVIEALGGTPSEIIIGDDKADDMVSDNIFQLKMEDVVKNMPGSGSGGSPALIVRYISDAEHTDKTFGEIYEAWLGGRIVIVAQNINDEYQTGQYGAIKQMWTSSSEGSDYYGWIEFEGCSLTTAVVSSMEEVMDEYLIYAD